MSKESLKKEKEKEENRKDRQQECKSIEKEKGSN